MGQEIDSLEIGISSTVGNATRSINTLIGKLESLDKVMSGLNTSGMQNLANGIIRLNGAVNQMKNSTASLNQIGKSLQKIGNIKPGNMYGISSASKALGSALTTFNNVDFNKVGRISEFTTALSKFGNIRVGNAANAIPNLANGIKTLVTELEKIDADKVDFSALQQIFDAISKMGRKTAENATRNLPELSKQLGVLMETLSRAPNISNNVVRITEALAKLSNAGAKVGTATRSMSSGLNSFSRHSSNARKSATSLAATIGKLYANFWILQRLLSGIGKAISTSMDYMETFNYFSVALDKIGDEFKSQYAEFGYASAEAYGRSFERRLNQLTSKMTGFNVAENGILSSTNQTSLGLDPNQVMSFQANIASITNAIGMTGEASVVTSKALTMLAGDLSSLKNVDVSQVMDNLTSGMVGMSKAVDKYGMSIRMADLQNTLYNLGINESVQTLDQNAKTQLRLITMLQQSQVAWGDLANTLNSPSNQLRQLSANFSNLTRMIGDLFIPVIASALPYVNGLVIAIQRLVTWIGSLLGVDVAIGSIMGDFGGSSDAISELIDDTDDLTNSLGGAGGAVEKLNKQLSSFDELNNQMSKDNSGGGGGGGANLDGLDLTDALIKAYGDYEKVWNEAYSRAENRATEFADRIEATFKRVAQAAEPTTKALKKLYNEGFREFASFNFDALDSFWNNYLKPMGKWVLGDDGLARFFNITNNLLYSINWNKLLGSLDKFYTALQKPTKFAFTGLLDFYESFLVPIAAWVIGDGLPAFYDIMSKLINSINWDLLNKALESLWKALGRFATSVGEGLIVFLESLASVLTPVISTALNALSIALQAFAKVIDLIPDSAITGLTSAFATFFLLWQAKTFVPELIGKVGTALKAFGGNFAAITATLMDGIQPWDVAIATVVGLKGVLTSLYSEVEPKPLTDAEEIELFGNTLEATAEQIEKTKTAIDSLGTEFEELKTAGYADIEYAKDLTDRYFELTAQTSLTTTEQMELQNVIAKMGELIPGLNSYLDEETGMYTLQKEAIAALIVQQETLYRLKAAQGQLESAYTNELAAMQNLKDAQEEYNLALDDASKKYLAWKEAEKEVMTYGYSGNLSMSDVEELEAAYLGAAQAVNTTGTALTEAREAYADSQEDIQDLTEYTNELQSAVNRIDYTQASLKAASAINSMHGIWVNGKQVLGQDAINIYNEIMNGLEPLPDGGYRIADGTVVYFGDALDKGKQDIVDTVDSTFVQSLESGLQEGYTIARDAGGNWVITTADAMNNNKDMAKSASANVVKSAKEGIDNETPQLMQSAINAANTVTNAWKSMGDGINNETPRLMQAAINATNVVTDVWTSQKPIMILNLNTANAEYQARMAAANISEILKTQVYSSLSLGATMLGPGKINVNIGAYATGGFPEDGWFRASHGEMIGQFDNGQSVVANNNQIVTGISQGVQSGFRMAQTEQNMILREQNDLLRQILEKETGISQSDIYNAVKRENRKQYNQTGTNQLVY